MRIYQSYDVKLTYQNQGSTWLGILRGKSEDIDIVFNGLFNLEATNGDYQFQDHLKTVATFWTNSEHLHRFFFNMRFNPVAFGKTCAKRPEHKHPAYRHCMRFADDRIQELRDTAHEFFCDFQRKIMPDFHSTGQVKAERPDVDFKDSVLIHAHQDNSFESIDKPDNLS